MNRTVFALCALLAVCSGCKDQKTVIHVEKDGSGTLTETVLYTVKAQNMIRDAYAQAAKNTGTEPPKVVPLYNAEELKRKAGSLGKNVTCVGVKELTGDNGEKGYRAVYAFKDVTTLTISDDTSAQSEAGNDAQIITFSFKKGKRPILKVHVKYPDSKKVDTKTPDTGENQGPEPDPARLKEIRELYAGMNFELRIHVAGKITKTNATYPDMADSSIIMMKMAIGKIVKDDALLRRFEKLSKVQSAEDAKTILKDFPHIDLETKEELSVEFK